MAYHFNMDPEMAVNKKQLLKWLVPAAIVLVSGFLLTLTLSLSFRVPDLLRTERRWFFLAFLTVPLGLIWTAIMYRMRKDLKRYCTRIVPLLLTLAVYVPSVALLTLFADPFERDTVTFTVKSQDPEKNYLLLASIHPREWINFYSRRAMPLVNPYMIAQTSGIALDDPGRVNLQRVVAGLPQHSSAYISPTTKAPQEKLIVEINRERLKRGAFFYFRHRNQNFTVEMDGRSFEMNIPRYTDFVPVPVSIETASVPAKPFPFRAIPGILLLTLPAALFLRRSARIIAHAPEKSGSIFAVLIPITGFFCSLYYFTLNYSPDPINQFLQGLTGRYAEWHPPVMAAVWIRLTEFFRFLTGTFSPVEPYLLLHLLMYWSGIGLIASRIGRRSFAAQIPVYFIAAVPFFFTEFNFMFAIAWKDCLLVSSLMLTLGLLLRFRKSNWRFLALLPFFFAMAVRGNAVLGGIMIAPLFFTPLYPPKGWKNLAKLAGCSIGLMVVILAGIHVLNWHVLDMHRQNPLSYPMMKEILAINHITKKMEWPSFITPQLAKVFETRYSYPKNNGGTDFYLHNQLKIGNLPQENYEELKVFWRKKVWNNPKAWIMQKNDSFCKQMRQYSTGINKLLHAWHLFWLSLTVVVLSATTCIRLYRKNASGCDLQNRIACANAALAVSLSGLGYISTYYIFAFVPDFRYIDWLFYAGFISLGLLCAAWQKRSQI